MPIHVISVAVLLALFVIATLRPINLGALALVATFGVGVLAAGQDLKTLLSGFPTDVLVLLVGVTYLFGIATVNGTIERIVDWAAGLLRGNPVAIPWAVFVLAAIPTTIGAAGPAGIAMLAPIAMRMAQKYGVNPRLVAVMLVQGSNAGNLSPLNVLGVIVGGTAARNGLDVSPTAMWLANLGFNAVLAVATFVVFGGIASIRAQRERTAVPVGVAGPPAPAIAAEHTAEQADTDDRARPSSTVFVSTVAAILLVAVGALGFGFDIGVLTVTAAVALNLLFPTSSAGAVAKIGWSTILLIGGVVTYVALMQRTGTVDAIGHSVAGISAPVLAALVLCLIAAVVSAFASSIGVLGAIIPLSLPVLASGGVPVTGLLIALAISATAVDATPFSSIGALTVASAPEESRHRVYSGLLRWGFAMVPIAPLATWLLFVVL
jgi:di/tricarboxylate transporter